MMLSLFAPQIWGIADADGHLIEGPWLWMIVPSADVSPKIEFPQEEIEVPQGLMPSLWGEIKTDVSTETDSPEIYFLDIDSLAAASNSTVREFSVAQGSAITAGDTVGLSRWTSSIIPYQKKECEEFKSVSWFFIFGGGTETKTECWNNSLNAVVDLLGLGRDAKKGHTAYALIYLISPREQISTMGVQSGDALHVWLNGDVVYGQAATHLDCRKVDIFGAPDHRTCIPDPRDWERKPHYFPVMLKAGPNLLLVKVKQHGTYWDLWVDLDADFSTTTGALSMIQASSPLGELTLDGNVITLRLNSRSFEPDITILEDALTVSGIPGVTIQPSSVQRISDIEVMFTLSFDHTDIDGDAELTFAVGDGAITNYQGAAYSIESRVAGIEESVDVSVTSPLGELTLDGSVITLTLSGRTLEADISTIRDALTVSGIPGVTIQPSSVQRISETEVMFTLSFDHTDIDGDVQLTFAVGDGAITNYQGAGLRSSKRVESTEESVDVSVASPLGELTLDGSVITLTLSGRVFEPDISTIRDALTVSGIPGVTIQPSSVQRISETEVTVTLDFDRTPFIDVPPPLTVSVGTGAISNYMGEAVTVEVSIVSSRDEQTSIYWTDPLDNTIYNGNLDGPNVEAFVAGLGNPTGIALDAADSKMYWTDAGTKKIQRANLNGSNVEDLVAQGLSGPRSIALDVAAGKMYWTDAGTKKIQRANLDGSNVEDLVAQGLGRPFGIALDITGGQMYWTDNGTDKIQRSDLDGSNVEDLVTGLGNPLGIALDIAGGKMYWTDNGTDKIQRSDLDGSNVEDLVTGLGNPLGIALDIAGGKIYWTDAGTKKIQRANLDGSNVKDLFTELVSPAGIAIVIDSSSPVTQEAVDHDPVAQEVVDHDAIVDVQEFVLLPNYPNPFNPETWIPYHLATEADVTLTIYDTSGQVVRLLKLGHQAAGRYQSRSRAAYWDGRNQFGEAVASGVYFYRLLAGNYSQTRKMVIIK